MRIVPIPQQTENDCLPFCIGIIRKIIFSIVSILLFSGTGAATVAQSTVVPDSLQTFTHLGPKILLPVNLTGPNGVSVSRDFIVDTGSMTTTVDNETANALNLHPSRYSNLVSSSGSTPAPVSGVPAVCSFSSCSKDVDVVISDMDESDSQGHHARGLLGINFLRSYKIIVDSQNSKIAFLPEDTDLTVFADGRS